MSVDEKGVVRGGPICLNSLTLPPKNVPFAECFNAGKENGNDKDSAGDTIKLNRCCAFHKAFACNCLDALTGSRLGLAVK